MDPFPFVMSSVYGKVFGVDEVCSKCVDAIDEVEAILVDIRFNNAECNHEL